MRAAGSSRRRSGVALSKMVQNLKGGRQAGGGGGAPRKNHVLAQVVAGVWETGKLKERNNGVGRAGNR